MGKKRLIVERMKNIRNFINFLVNNPSNTFFVKSYDITDIKKTNDIISEIKTTNIIQIITSNATNYITTVLKIKKRVIANSCTIHRIDLILENI